MRRTPLRRAAVSPSSADQGAKVAGHRCLVCARRPVDPAHPVPRSLGGCDHADCVVPLCRRCHSAYDRGDLDLLAYLEPRFRAEFAHALAHLPMLAVLQRVTGQRWAPDETGVGGVVVQAQPRSNAGQQDDVRKVGQYLNQRVGKQPDFRDG